MPINKDTLNKIIGMGDEDFKKLIAQIASAAGADPYKTAAFLKDTGRLKEMLRDMTPEEADQLLNKVGKGRAESILRDIEGSI